MQSSSLNILRAANLLPQSRDYHKEMPTDSLTDRPGASLSGKTVILTGATSGLGYEAAIKFLNLGVKSLVFGIRDLEKGARVKTELEERTKRPGVIQVWKLEMSSFQSVKDFAKRVQNELTEVDTVVLNAGLWNKDYVKSADGWEETMQVNTLSTALLAMLLLPKLKESSGSAPTHLTIVSSQLFTRVKADNIRTDGSLLNYLSDQQNFGAQKQYGISKLVLEYVTKTIAHQVCNEDGSTPVIVNTVSPGLCRSSLGRQFDRFYERWAVGLMHSLIARTSEEGAHSIVTATFQGPESQGKCWRIDNYIE